MLAAALLRDAGAASARPQTTSSIERRVPPGGQHNRSTAEATLEVNEDELDKYLSLPVEKNIDLDVLAWWKAKDCQKDGLPILAKMARQFLGRPASSAGVERMFSKAGKLHGEDKASQEDGTLEHCLFASANTE